MLLKIESLKPKYSIIKPTLYTNTFKMGHTYNKYTPSTKTTKTMKKKDNRAHRIVTHQRKVRNPDYARSARLRKTYQQERLLKVRESEYFEHPEDAGVRMFVDELIAAEAASITMEEFNKRAAAKAERVKSEAALRKRLNMPWWWW